MKPTLYQRLDFAVWQRIHQMPRFLVEFWQERELKKTILNAYNNIPLYRQLLDEGGIDPKSVDIKSLKKLPLMSKKLFRQHPIEKWTRITQADPKEYTWRQTSGSTGEPFRFPFNADANLYARFKTKDYASYLSMRYLIWRGISRRYFTNSTRIARITTKERSDGLCIPIAHLRERPEEVLLRLKQYQPAFIYGRPTTIVELGRIAEAKKMFIRIPYAYTYGETITIEQRMYLKKIFNCDAYNAYGLEETGEVAVDCIFHNGLHTYEESCIFEILNERNERMPEGSTGRIILTYFYNDVMPLIRYDTMDLGYLIKQKCPCGLSTPRIFVEGRVQPPAIVGNKKIFLTELKTIMTEFHTSILRWQVAKVSKSGLQVRIIPTSVYDPDISAMIRAAFLKKLNLEPDVRIVTSVSYSPTSGKNYFFVDEVNV